MKLYISLVLPLTLLFSCSVPSEPSKNVVINGRITDEDTKKGIEGASLTIYDQDTTIKALTNAEGAFNLSVKKKSDYNFKVEAGGYVPVNGSFNFLKSDSVFSSYQLTPYMDNDSTETGNDDAEQSGGANTPGC